MTKKIFTPSAEQSAFLNWVETGSGSCVLEAVAGAGKTTTLVEGVRRMKGSIFLGAFNKKMAEELKTRIKDFPNAKAGTFHSAGFSALRRVNDKIEIDEKKVRKIAEELAREAGHEHEPEFYSAVCKLVSLAKQTGFRVATLVPNTPARFWMELVNRHDIGDDLSEDADLNELCHFADAVLTLSNEDKAVIDFDDMIYMPLLRNLRLFRNDWVLIDEAQDTNAVRRELAARMLRPGGRLVAVGDPHQAIYGFTGADNDSLDLIKRDFRAITLKLSVSWRCPQAVVAAARDYVDHIRPADTAAMGSVTSIRYRQMLDTVSPGEAILCRFNAPLVETCFRLIREGKAAKIEGRAIGDGLIALVGRWKVKTLDALEGRLQKWLEKELAKIEASPKKDEGKKAAVEDKHATVLVLLERAREQGMTTVEELKTMIRNMFDDVGAAPNLVVLSSVHRSKGLEWHRVHILGRGEIMPPKRQMQDWQMEQEINLCYVAVTRAQVDLIDVALPTPDDLKPKAKEEEKKEAA